MKWFDTGDPNYIFHSKIPECACTQQSVKEIEDENPDAVLTILFIYGENILVESGRNASM